MLLTSSITRLFNSCCPTAITWFVVTVWIWITIKATIRRARSHVGNEHFKVFPTHAHFNSAASISFPCVIFRIGTPLPHLHPTPKFSTLCHVVSSTRARLALACGGASGHSFTQKTPTTGNCMPQSLPGNGRLPPKLASLDNRFISTIALTNPLWFLRNNRSIATKNDQSPYAFSSKVNDLRSHGGRTISWAA